MVDAHVVACDQAECGNSRGFTAQAAFDARRVDAPIYDQVFFRANRKRAAVGALDIHVSAVGLVDSSLSVLSKASSDLSGRHSYLHAVVELPFTYISPFLGQASVLVVPSDVVTTIWFVEPAGR